MLASLVGVAAVGRTLGVHMILATQRPAGVVNEDILANTNLRIALRVQSRDDSINVVGVPAAAAIGRTQMGRAYVKLGQDDITPVQTALVTGRAESSASTLVDVHPIGFGEVLEPATAAAAIDEDAPTDLDLLIDADRRGQRRRRLRAAAPVVAGAAGGAPRPGRDPRGRRRRPARRWRAGSTVQVALADEPRPAAAVPRRLGPRPRATCC